MPLGEFWARWTQPAVLSVSAMWVVTTALLSTVSTRAVFCLLLASLADSIQSQAGQQCLLIGCPSS